jgi:Cu-Zn family superoxide dismutase
MLALVTGCQQNKKHSQHHTDETPTTLPAPTTMESPKAQQAVPNQPADVVQPDPAQQKAAPAAQAQPAAQSNAVAAQQPVAPPPPVVPPAPKPQPPVATTAPATKPKPTTKPSTRPVSAATRPVIKSAVAVIKPSKAATTQPINNNITGTLSFTVLEDGKIHVVGDISGLTPNAKHGIHIHDKKNMNSPDLMSTGDHFNPNKHQHGAPGATSHAGDLGNLQADAAGKAHVDVMLSGVSLGTGQANDILGRPVIIHAGEDDLTSQPSGKSGARVAGGLIAAK